MPSVVPLLDKIDQYILNPLLGLLFLVALFYFFIGVYQFVSSDMSDKARTDGKSKILYGILGMFIMVSAYGLVRIVLGTFGLGTDTGFIQF